MTQEPIHGSQPATRREERREAVVLVLVAVPVVLALAFALFVCYRLFSVPASSMAPNLPVGSYVLVSRLSYGFTPHTFDWFDLDIAERWPKGEIRRGDIIAFRKLGDRRTVYVKRVIGLGGDRVELAQGRVRLNGALLERRDAGTVGDMIFEEGPVPAYLETTPEGAQYRIMEEQGDKGPFDNTQEFAVPAQALFVMGDNRDNSADSRFSEDNGVGFVPVNNVIGKVVLSF